MEHHSPISPDQTLADLATTRAGASRVFARHGLDFCCRGQIGLADACAAKGLDVDRLVDEIVAECRTDAPSARWDRRPLPELVEHIVTRFHQPLREELPRLARMAARVEAVHGDKPACPRGLAAALADFAAELELHMQKEEDVLFPELTAARGPVAPAPIQAMEQEHLDHAEVLGVLRTLTGDHVPPPEACGTWRALYLGLAELEAELMAHVHLENHVLFPRALRPETRRPETLRPETPSQP